MTKETIVLFFCEALFLGVQAFDLIIRKYVDCSNSDYINKSVFEQYSS